MDEENHNLVQPPSTRSSGPVNAGWMSYGVGAPQLASRATGFRSGNTMPAGAQSGYVAARAKIDAVFANKDAIDVEMESLLGLNDQNGGGSLRRQLGGGPQEIEAIKEAIKEAAAFILNAAESSAASVVTAGGAAIGVGYAATHSAFSALDSVLRPFVGTVAPVVGSGFSALARAGATTVKTSATVTAVRQKFLEMEAGVGAGAGAADAAMAATIRNTPVLVMLTTLVFLCRLYGLGSPYLLMVEGALKATLAVLPEYSTMVTGILNMANYKRVVDILSFGSDIAGRGLLGVGILYASRLAMKALWKVGEGSLFVINLLGGAMGKVAGAVGDRANTSIAALSAGITAFVTKYTTRLETKIRGEIPPAVAVNQAFVEAQEAGSAAAGGVQQAAKMGDGAEPAPNAADVAAVNEAVSGLLSLATDPGGGGGGKRGGYRKTKKHRRARRKGRKSRRN